MLLHGLLLTVDIKQSQNCCLDNGCL